VDVVLDDRVIDLVSEGIDIALRMGDLADSSAVARRLATGRRSVVATPAYLAEHGVPQVPADISAHQAVVYTQIGRSWTFRKDGTEASVVVSGRVQFSAAEGIRAAIKAHMGLAVTSDWMFWPELISGEVARVLEDWELPRIDLWAVFPTGRLASAKARAFADFVEQVVG
jgi:DNA-binding transcriptional LysR family regulator